MKYLIASFPRSGNHWVRYIVEYCTRLRTMGEGAKKYWQKHDRPIFERIGNKFYNGERYIGRKRHKIKKPDKGLDMILIVRNYREVLPRHQPKLFTSSPKITPRLDEISRYYINLIRYYHNWPQRKMLVYYEDLISNVYEIYRIMKFINHTHKFCEFHNSIDEHRNKCLCICNHVTDGTKPVFHSKKLTAKWIDLLDGIFDKWPGLKSNYLDRYCI